MHVTDLLQCSSNDDDDEGMRNRRKDCMCGVAILDCNAEFISGCGSLFNVSQAPSPQQIRDVLNHSSQSLSCAAANSVALTVLKRVDTIWCCLSKHQRHGLLIVPMASSIVLVAFQRPVKLPVALQRTLHAVQLFSIH